MSRFRKADRERISKAWSDPSVLQSPFELHALAIHWNWDNGIAPLWGIIRHPLCDRGTALMLYWYALPTEIYQSVASEQEIQWEDTRQRYQFIKEIESRFAEGFYQNQGICFNPNTQRLEPYHEETLKQPIPSYMLEPSPGRQVSEKRLWLGNEW